MSGEMDRARQTAIRQYGPMPATPEDALAHVLCAFAHEPNDSMAVTATTDLYGDGTRTGLTFGDLRAIQQQLEDTRPATDASIVQFPKKHP